MLRKLVVAIAIGVVSAAAFARSADPDGQIRAAFEAFVKAQNAHDPRALEPLLLDSPKFLWITRGNAVWGRAEALKRFESLYAGTWHLEPDFSDFQVVLAKPEVAQIFVPIEFTIGPPGQPAQISRFLMNQVLVRVDGAWRIASILPIPATPPPAASPRP